MKDILGRELKQGDIVVCKGGTRSYKEYPSKVKEMELGIVHKSGVRTLTSFRNPKDKFLVENPGPMELAIALKIQKLLSRQEQDAKEKRNNTIKAKEIGKIYRNAKERFIYLGDGEVTFYFKRNAEDNKVIESQFYNNTGKVYLIIPNNVSLGADGSVDLNSIYAGIQSVYYATPKSTVSVINGYKSAMESIGKIRDDIPKHFVIEGERFKIEINLE